MKPRRYVDCRIGETRDVVRRGDSAPGNDAEWAFRFGRNMFWYTLDEGQYMLMQF